MISTVKLVGAAFFEKTFLILSRKNKITPSPSKNKTTPYLYINKTNNGNGHKIQWKIMIFGVKLGFILDIQM